MTENRLLRYAQVEAVEDDNAGLRIRVRLMPEDADCTTIEELPYCYPLLPKHVHLNPKVGEMVIVLPTMLGAYKSTRWFIGPLISQPYFLDSDPYNFSARSLIDQGKYVKPLPNPELNPDNNGTLPNREDVALQGRHNADVVLKDNEVRIRCGYKQDVKYPREDSLKFNEEDLSYIQLKNKKRSDHKGKDYSTSINVVGDRINLISHDARETYRLNDREELVTDDEMKRMLENLHPLVYGDELVAFLKKLVELIRTHVHPFPGSPPALTAPQTSVLNTDLDAMLSYSVKTN